MEAADVDAIVAEQRADAADEAGCVLVDDVEHVPLEFGLDADAEDFDQPRRAGPEQRPGHRTVSLRGRDGNAQQRMIDALAIMAHLAHVEPALFRQERRVDHVHRVRIAPHQPRQHRTGYRLARKLRRRALALDADLGEIAVRELAHERAQAFGQLHIGPQLGRFLGAEARHVERVGDAAADEEVRHLFGHLQRDIDLRLGGRRPQMRRADEVGLAEQRAGGGRLGLEHVERSAGDMAAVEQPGQRLLVDQPAAGAIDDTDAGLRLCKVFRREDVARLVGQGRVERNEVGSREQCVEFDLLDPDLDRALGRQEGVEGDDFHAQADGARGDDGADVARPDQSQRLAGDLDAHEAVLGPLAGLGALIGLGDLPRQREHHRDGVLGGGDRIAEGGVHHHHALGAGGGNIDIIHPDAGAADHLEVARGGEDVGGDLGRTADCEAVVPADAGLELLGRLAGDDIDIAAALAKDARGVLVHLVGNEDFGFGHFVFLVIPANAGIAVGIVGLCGTRSQLSLGHVIGEAMPRPSRARDRAPRCRRYRRSRRTRS